jgi:hypothetical protein
MTKTQPRPRSSRTIREKRKEFFLSALAKMVGSVALILVVAAVFRVGMSRLWEGPVEMEAVLVGEQELSSGGASVSRLVERPVAAAEEVVEPKVVPKAVPIPARAVVERELPAAGGMVSGIERIEAKQDVIGQALGGFFAAENVDEKLRWVRDPERVRPLMVDFYASHELRDQGWKGVGWVKAVAEPGFRFGYVQALFEKAEPVAVVVEELADGRVVVDWESSVRYGELPWREFVQARPERPTLLRMLASRSDRAPEGPGGEISGMVTALSLRHPSDSEPVEAVFDRSNPQLSPLVEQLEAGGWKNVPVTLRLCFPGAESNSKMKTARITAVEGRGWLILSQKRS